VFGLIILAVLISSITNTMIELSALNRGRLQQFRALNVYLKRYRVSAGFTLRAKTGLVAQQRLAIDLQAEQETLRALPKQIMVDLLYEIREPWLMVNYLLRDFSAEFPRMMRRVCADATKMMIVHEDEVVFAKGDDCCRMLLVVSGMLVYEHRKPTARPSQRQLTPKSLKLDAPLVEDQERVSAKQCVSEAALWIEWENRGELTGCKFGSLLAVDAHDFMSVVTLFKDARSRATLYARVFVEKLRETAKWSDVMPPVKYYMPNEDEEEVEQTRASTVSNRTARQASGVSDQLYL
jgi:hypothetical protein